MLTRARAILLTMALLAVPAVAAVAQPQTAPDGFVPVAPGELQQEQIPAAPLVFAAYAIVWLALAFYVVTVWRRVSRVEAELRTLTARLEERGR
ncbi:MAG: CcmD family protein [Acidobacteriota bacterium]|jgi:CcmD family protein